MTKEKGIDLEGTIVETLPDAFFRVKINETHTVLARISGKIDKNFIRVLLGDRVRVEVSPYDLQRGRITYRYR